MEGEIIFLFNRNTLSEGEFFFFLFMIEEKCPRFV